MKREILTKGQLAEIEQQVDSIIALVDRLNPNNPDDSEILYYKDIELNKYVTILEESYKNARIEESGFKIVH
jgi:hypothetical protein